MVQNQEFDIKICILNYCYLLSYVNDIECCIWTYLECQCWYIFLRGARGFVAPWPQRKYAKMTLGSSAPWGRGRLGGSHWRRPGGGTDWLSRTLPRLALPRQRPPSESWDSCKAWRAAPFFHGSSGITKMTCILLSSWYVQEQHKLCKRVLRVALWISKSSCSPYDSILVAEYAAEIQISLCFLGPFKIGRLQLTLWPFCGRG